MSAIVSGASLLYGGTFLSGSLPNVTLTVGEYERVPCVQLTGPVPTATGWYNPRGQLVSRDVWDEVHQVHSGAGRIAYLNFRNYQQSQGGTYECRVAVPGRSLETLPLLISQCYLHIFFTHNLESSMFVSSTSLC